ncbi:hypothetical protein [Deinococcus ficus]|uniref:hypothetical protein n=1 Tax=Deinococcus ficus TaxID=317577 RepID=UPI00131E02FD|nr:hypothetical protein [Deinococcus ficus]
MFTYPLTNIPARDFTSLAYALYRVRQIARDTRENPPYSLSDEEWGEILEDTKAGNHYQVYKAVHKAISTNPERLASISEESGSYNFTDLEQVKKELLKSQRELNFTLKIAAPANAVVTVPIYRVW